MAADQLGGTVGTGNPPALRWFCRCTIKEDARYLAVPVGANAFTRWPAEKAAADPPAAAPRDNPAADQIRALRSPLPAAGRVPSGLNAATVTDWPWRTSGSGRPLAVCQARARGPGPAPPGAGRVPSGLTAAARTAALDRMPIT